jgi:hypothetical protein
MHQVVVVIPIDADIDEAQNLAQENRDERLQNRKVSAMRRLHFQHHDRDDDGDHTIAESLKPTLSHSCLVCA